MKLPDAAEMVDQDISHKIDIQAIEAALKHLPDTYIYIACTEGDDIKPDQWPDKGYDNHIIVIPYEVLKNADNPLEVIKSAIEERLKQAA